ncbi:hypothetical protein FV232_26045 [Methylobacterium sp. WL30]|uniref:phage tail tip lysozyme n=1 Tax=unclassified Methylobacterium TaxID=2615210 RepID=UPI0011C80CF6|nr:MULTISPECIES: phage tail tip lysozyme [unclassified Methylobacterium]TXN41804.1 hypothetical protein FV225_00965 [Methylobacterium sp. WL93]TXN51883.1 hypothetical protein FV227_05985 [Methylobacterium sp. WL119]TXN62116.1 hypothetical protein FV232_26045 [Methylobacterium sp. WL30]
MADERLRLVAEVQDGFTGPLAKLETALGRAAKTGTQAGKDLKRDFEGFNGALGKTTAALQGMTPVLSGLGLVGLSAGVSLGAVTAALSGFSKGTQQLAIMSKETGLAVDQLRAFSALGERFGVSAETMQGGVRKFADEMSQMRKRYGQTYFDLQQMNLGELVEKMVSSPNMKAALDTFMDSVSQIGDPVKRRKVVEMMLGSDQIAAVAGQLTGRYREVMDEILKAQGQTTDAQVKAAQRFETALSRVRENMDGLRTEALAPLLEQLSALVEKFGSAESMAAFAKQLEEIGKFARTTVQEFEAIVRTYEKFKEFIGLGDPSKNVEFKPLLSGGGSKPLTRGELEGKRDSIEQQRKLLDANPNAPDYARKRDRMTEELRRVGDELEKLRTSGGATAQPSGFSGVTGGGNPLIQRASFGRGGGGSGGGFYGVGTIPPLGMPEPAGGAGHGAAAGRSSPPLTGGGVTPESAGVLTPRGTGRGNPRAARTSEMMAYAMDQLRREGVPEAHLRQSAAHLVGQATMESGLDPNKVHDGGSGYGIYGARDPKGWGNYRGARRSAMVRWLEANGYARNSAEGQMRYMTHEAMGGGYPQTRRILMGQGTGDIDQDTHTITRNFEAPRVANYRAGAVRAALRAGPDDRALSASQAASPAPNERLGDQMMGRMFAREATPPPPQTHRMTIDLNGFPPGTRARTSMGDLFRETTVSKKSQMEAI